MTITKFILDSKQSKSPLLASLRALADGKLDPKAMKAEEAIFTMEPW